MSWQNPGMSVVRHGNLVNMLKKYFLGNLYHLLIQRQMKWIDWFGNNNEQRKVVFEEGKSDRKRTVDISDLGWILRDLITGEENKIPRSKTLIKV